MTTLERAIKVYGKDMQLNVAIEELSELIKEICKKKRGEENREAIIEEMADCEIMLSQLQIIFNIRTGEIAAKAIEKMERLSKRLDELERQEEAQDDALKDLSRDMLVGLFSGGIKKECKRWKLTKKNF